MIKKSLFIIPGFKHAPSHIAYAKLAKNLKKQGYDTVPVSIPWKENSLSQNTKLFLKEFKKTRTKKNYILGFSFGAIIALLASTKVNVTGLILCSLSPYFKEDLNEKKRKSKQEDFLKLRSDNLAKKIKAKKVLMMYGTRETKPLIKRVTETYDQILIRYKYLIPINATEHNIGDKRYLYKIYQTTRALL